MPPGDLVASGLDRPGLIAFGGGQLYVATATADANALYRVPLDGGAPVMLAQAPLISALTADASGVYWLTAEATDAHVMALAAGSSSPTVLAEIPKPATWYPGNLVADDAALYFAAAGSVVRTPKAGGGSVAIAQTDTTISWTALDAEGLWVATVAGARHVATDDGTVLEERALQTRPDELASDGTTVYALFSGTGAADGAIARVTDDAPVLADGLVEPGGLAAAPGGDLYVATGNLDQAVRRIDAGGGQDVLARDHGPVPLALDDAHVYWCEADVGAVYSTAR